MHVYHPRIGAVASDLPGQPVVFADGEALGVVTEVVATPASASHPASHALVVQAEHVSGEAQREPLLIPDATVLMVTDDAVVLGTTARWLDQHIVAE